MKARRIIAVLLAFGCASCAPTPDAMSLHEAAEAFDQAALHVDREPADELARWQGTIRLSIAADVPRATAELARDLVVSLAGEVGLAVEHVAAGGDLVIGMDAMCATALEWDTDGIIHGATVSLARHHPPGSTRCAHHEILHAFGLRAHPATPASVLSYHPQAARQVTALDRLMLRALYDPRLQPSMPIADAPRVARGVLADALRARRQGRAP